MNSKYSGFLTILLIVIIIAIIGIIGFLGFKYYQTYMVKTNSEEFVDTFGEQTQNSSNKNNNTNTTPSNNNGEFEGVNEGANNSTPSDGSSSQIERPKYNGYYTTGTIEIPTTNLKSPILARSEYSPSALETAVVELYGPGLMKLELRLYQDIIIEMVHFFQITKN